MRLLHAHVRSCSDCPFMETIIAPVKSDHGMFPAGYMCLHKDRKRYLAELSLTTEGETLNGYLCREHGQPFPPDCPLPEVTQGTPPAGAGRSLDLQPAVSPELDKKS